MIAARWVRVRRIRMTGALYAYADPPYLGCGNLYAAQMSEVYL